MKRATWLVLPSLMLCAGFAFAQDQDEPEPNTAPPEAAAPAAPAEKPASPTEKPPAAAVPEAAARKEALPKAPAPKAPAPKAPAPKAPVPKAPAPKAPAPVAQPKAPPPPAPAPPPVAAVSPSDAAVTDVAAWTNEIDTLQAELPKSANRLEGLCQQRPSKNVRDAYPGARGRRFLCLAHVSFAIERLDDAKTRLAEAEKATLILYDDALKARIALLRGQLIETELRADEPCGTALGLSQLRTFESEWTAERVAAASAAYRAVIDARAEPWATHAIHRLASLSVWSFEQSVAALPRSFRGLTVPSPFTLATVDAVEAPGPLSRTGSWGREINTLFALAATRAGELGNHALQQQILEEQKAFREKAEPQFGGLKRKDAVPAGAIRAVRGAFERFEAGRWKTVEKTAAQAVLVPDQNAQFLTSTGAWSMVALSQNGNAPAEDLMLAVLQEPSDARFDAAVAVALKDPKAAYFKPLLDAWGKTRAGKPWRKDEYLTRYGDAASAVYGREERILRALSAIVTKERTLAGTLTYEGRLPLDERAYIASELADHRLSYRLQELLGSGDDTTSAIALYGLYKTAGKRNAWMLRQYSRGKTGCVARHLRALDDRRRN